MANVILRQEAIVDLTHISEVEIEVIRILHERMDLKNRMND